MKTLALIFISAAIGWFSCLTLDCWLERIHDWREPAYMAGLFVVSIVVLLACFP